MGFDMDARRIGCLAPVQQAPEFEASIWCIFIALILWPTYKILLLRDRCRREFMGSMLYSIAQSMCTRLYLELCQTK